MYRGCFLWTLTPALSDRRTRRPGPAHVCVCVPFLARSGRPSSLTSSRASHLSCGRSWALFVSSTPSKLGVSSFPLCAPVVSGVPCFPAGGALGLGILLPPPPPPFLFSSFFFFFFLPGFPLFFVFFCFPRLFFLLFCEPLLSPAFRVFGPGVPWALAPCCPPAPPPSCFFLFFIPPPFLFFFLPAFPLFLAFFCFFPRSCLAGLQCGAGLCVLGSRVCWCVLPRCCPCRCFPFSALLPLWRSLVLCGVACCAWVFAVGPGSPLWFPGGSWCHVSVVLSLSGRLAHRPVVWCGVSWCSAALCCVLWRWAVVWWCAVVLC